MNNTIHDLDALALAGNPKVKKGDTVYLVSLYQRHGVDSQPSYFNGKFQATQVVIQSWGKKTGTATNAADTFIKRSIWTSHQIVRRTLEEVEALRAEFAPAMVKNGKNILAESIATHEQWAVDYAVKGLPLGHSRNKTALEFLRSFEVGEPTIQIY